MPELNELDELGGLANGDSFGRTEIHCQTRFERGLFVGRSSEPRGLLENLSAT